MLKISLNNLWSRRRRMLGTFLAVFLGVAFLSGTLALGDTLSANFDTLFSRVTRGTDAVVRGATNVSGDSPRATRGPVDQSLVGTVRSVSGVGAAEPYVEGLGTILGKDGKAIGGNGPPRMAANWVSNPDLNPYHVVEGRAPQAADEVVINKGAADDGNLHLGDTAVVQTPDPVTVRIVGLAKFGSEDGLGGSTFVAFTLAAAQQHLMAHPGQVTSILVKGNGVPQSDLVQRIDPVLPRGVETVTGAQITKENIDNVNQVFLSFLRTFLVVFAGIALLVATFSIYNTFSIIGAQRSRESALLRAVGATRRQVLVSALLESLVVGVVASVAGLIGGVAVAGLLKGMFDAFGFALPAGGLVFSASTIITGLVVGVVVTLVAGAAPAVRSSRVRPVAALRDAAAEPPRVSQARIISGFAIGAVGVATVLASVLGNGSGTLALAGLGALLTIVGVVVFGPAVAGPIGSALGAPLARLRGVTGSLARGNATRNPRRTSATAAALLVGVAVVTLFTTFGSSIKASMDRSISRSFGGDLVINSGSFARANLSPRLAGDVSRLPEVQTAVGIGEGFANVGPDSQDLRVVDPAQLSKVLDVEVKSGSLTDVGNRQLAVVKKLAEDKHWQVGSVVPVTFADGTTTPFTVAAVYDNGDVAGDVLMSRAAWAPHALQDRDRTVLIKLKPGVSLATGKAAVERVAAPYGGPTVEDRTEFAASISQGVNMILGLIYVLLLLAIVIATMGIANTLSLSIYERTRELGVLRAVGQTRAQLRSMVRWESTIVSTFGAIGGVGVGVFLGWALVQAAASSGGGPSSLGVFAVPGGQLVVVLLLGALVGVLAALQPARRAARLNVLDAIAAR
jgi:putative ABC transport system permease protein